MDTKNQDTIKTVKISTNLYKKDEVLRLLKVAEIAKLPILLVGLPGVGKTAAVLDYAKSICVDEHGAVNKDVLREKTFILETDEGTKSSEVKGRMDIKHLVENKEYRSLTPIVKAEYVVINEVDKASSNLRNSLLGVMNEKTVFNGTESLDCKWKLFVATCNVIPKEEESNPFWDRFLLKFDVKRLSPDDLVAYFDKGGKSYVNIVNLPDPTQEQVDAIDVPNKYVEQFIHLAHKKVSDRTLSFVKVLTKAVAATYNSSVEKAIVKVMSLLVSNNAAQELSKTLMSAPMKELVTKVELLNNITNPSDFNRQVSEIEKNLESAVNSVLESRKITMKEAEEIADIVDNIVKNHPLMEEENNLENNEFIKMMNS